MKQSAKYIAVRGDGLRVRHGDQIGYTTYPGHTAPTWFEFATGTQNCDQGGESGGQIVIRYERYGRMVTPLRAGSDFGLTVYSVLDPQVADLLSQDELDQLAAVPDNRAPSGQKASRLLGIRPIPVPPRLLE